MAQTLTTQGTGTASAPPDAMRIGVAVVVRSSAVAQALAGTTSGVEALGEVARRFTADEQIASTGLHVWPAYDEHGRPSGYEARHTLSVYCLGLAKAGELVTALGDLHSRVLVESVEPVIADPAPLAVTARQRAWTDARSKADELATLAGLTVTGVVSIAEGGQAQAPVEARPLAVKADAVRFEPGAQSVSATLTVTWSLG
jgi:uncharacterized protein